MKVKSFNTEFGYELISTLPYAYYLHTKGLLTETESANDTKCFYYFSLKHVENNIQRSWYNTEKSTNPNVKIHVPNLDLSQFAAPNFKEQYANETFKFEKETIVICNRVNIEWGVRHINYFDLPTLKQLFELLQNDYQVIYINIEGKKDYYDNENPISIGDYDLLKKYPKVINIHELHAKHSDLTFNELQLQIFANCQKFVTMNGGHAILASYFGGENIIMSKFGRPQAKELSENVNSFYRWYNIFGNSRAIHVPTENYLIEKIKTNWIEKQPIVNILVRTSNRPIYFKKCIESIENQTYKNVNVFVSYDNENTNKYLIPYKVYPVKVNRKNENEIKLINDSNFGLPFPSNLYLNYLFEKIQSGIVLYLDDDDKLSEPTALAKIVKELEKSELCFWNVKNKNRVIPKASNFGKEPVCCDISGIGFAYKKHLGNGIKWTEWKRGDYRVAAELYKRTKKVSWINEILTETQNGEGFGYQKDLGAPKFNENNYMKVTIIKTDTKFGKITNTKVDNKIVEIKEGTTIDLSESTAIQWIKQGICKRFIEHKPEIIETKIDEPEVKEVFTYEKKVSKPKKLK